MNTMVKENLKVPKLRFGEFSGELMNLSAGDVFMCISNKNHNGNLEILAITQDKGAIPRSLINYDVQATEDSINSYKIVEKGDFIISLRSFQGGIEYSNYTGICSPAYIVLKPKQQIIDRYFKYYLKTYNYILQLRRTLEGIRDGKMIPFRYFANTVLFVPTLAEQEKIANYLSALDEKLNLLSEKEKNLAQYKKAMMQKLFAQEIRFKDDEGKEFEAWEDTIGGDIFISHTNKNHDGTLDILAITQEHGAIPRKLIDYSVQVSDESVNNYKVVEKDDFIISLRSFQGGIEHSNYYGICSPAYIILRNKIPIVPLFYKAFFKSRNYINYLNRTLEGIRDGKMISYGNFAKSKLPYPCLAEQEKIAQFLSAIDEKINAVQKQIEAMQEFKKAMLQQMFV